MQLHDAINKVYDVDDTCLKLIDPSANASAYELYHECKLDQFKQYDDYNFLVYLDDVEQDLFKMNMILRLSFGIPGLIFAILVIVLISRIKELHTQFGIICSAIGICDLMLFIYMVLIEEIYDIRFMEMGNPYLVSSPDLDAPFNIFGIRIDRITYYLGACCMTSCVLLGTLKSLQRFLALYFPIYYQTSFTMKVTYTFCILLAIVVHIGFAPVLFINTIDIRYVYGRYLFGAANNYALYSTSINVKFVREYIDYGNIIASIILDIATAIKLYKINRTGQTNWSKQKSTLEKLFLLQNFSNVFTCIFLIISYFMFVQVCKGAGSNCMDNFIKRFLRMLYNYGSSKVMWRCLDEMVTFFFQLRAYHIYKKETSGVSITVSAWTR